MPSYAFQTFSWMKFFKEGIVFAIIFIGFGLAFAAIELSDTFFLQPEVFYTAKGCKFEYPGEDVTFILNYIEVPVLIKYLNQYMIQN